MPALCPKHRAETRRRPAPWERDREIPTPPPLSRAPSPEDHEKAQILKRYSAWRIRNEDARTKRARAKRLEWLTHNDIGWETVLGNADRVLALHPDVEPAREMLLEEAAHRRCPYDLEEFRWTDEEKAERAARAVVLDAEAEEERQAANTDPLKDARWATEVGAKAALKRRERALVAAAKRRREREGLTAEDAHAIGDALYRRFGGGNRYNRIKLRVEEDEDELGRPFWVVKTSWTQAHFPPTALHFRRPLLAEGDELGMGAYALTSPTNEVNRVSFDIDQHRDGQNAAATFAALKSWLDARAVPHVDALSKGGSGFHVHVFTCVLTGLEAANLGRGIVRAAGLPADTEVFPKAAREESSYGNAAGAIGLPGGLGFAETTGGSVFLDANSKAVPIKAWAALLDNAGSIDRARVAALAAECGQDLHAPTAPFTSSGASPRASSVDLEPFDGPFQEVLLSTPEQAAQWLADCGHEIVGSPREKKDKDGRSLGVWHIKTRRCPTAARHKHPGRVGQPHSFTFTPSKQLPMGSRCLNECCGGIKFHHLANHWGVVVGNPAAGYVPRQWKAQAPAGRQCHDSPDIPRRYLSAKARDVMHRLSDHVGTQEMGPTAMGKLAARAARISNLAKIAACCGEALRPGERHQADLQIHKCCNGPHGTVGVHYAACERRATCIGCSTYFARRVQDFIRNHPFYKDGLYAVWFAADPAIESWHVRLEDVMRQQRLLKRTFFSSRGWRKPQHRWVVGVRSGVFVMTKASLEAFDLWLAKRPKTQAQLPGLRVERYEGTARVHEAALSIAQLYAEPSHLIADAAEAAASDDPKKRLDGAYDLISLLELYKSNSMRRSDGSRKPTTNGAEVFMPIPWFSELDCRAYALGVDRLEVQEADAEKRRQRKEDKDNGIKRPRPTPQKSKCGRRLPDGSECQEDCRWKAVYRGEVLCESDFSWDAKKKAFYILLQRRDRKRWDGYLRAVG